MQLSGGIGFHRWLATAVRTLWAWVEQCISTHMIIIEGCPGTATSHANLRQYFMHRHPSDTLVICKEGSIPLPKCENCGMHVPRRAMHDLSHPTLLSSHLSTIALGIKSKRWLRDTRALPIGTPRALSNHSRNQRCAR
jgi:hypothetical protein